MSFLISCLNFGVCLSMRNVNCRWWFRRDVKLRDCFKPHFSGMKKFYDLKTIHVAFPVSFCS